MSASLSETVICSHSSVAVLSAILLLGLICLITVNIKSKY